MKFTTVIALLLSTTSAAKVAPVAKSANDAEWESNKTQFAGKDVTPITAVVTSTTTFAGLLAKTQVDCLKACETYSKDAANENNNVVCQAKGPKDAITACDIYDFVAGEVFAATETDTSFMYLIKGIQQVTKDLGDGQPVQGGAGGGNAPPACDAACEALKLTDACKTQPDAFGVFKSATCRKAAEGSTVHGSYKGFSPLVSFGSNLSDTAVGVKTQDRLGRDAKTLSKLRQSVTQNTWTNSAQIGCIVGYAVFALGYLYAIVMLAVDMRARDAMYQTYIDEDVEKLQQMGLGGKMREFEAELAKRIAGEGDGEGVDDQLITQALNLERNEFQRYM